MREVLVEVVLVFAEGKFITLLIPTVVIWLFLYGIIRQMDELVRKVVIDKYSRWGAQVSIVIGEAF